jgi:uncharacterized protein (DUF58 family)
VRTRPTASGTALGAVGLVSLGAGLAAGYAEVALVGVVAAVALVAAVVFPRVGSPLDLERVGTPTLVARGSTVEVRLTASAAAPVPPVRVLDQFAAARVAVDLPAVRPGRAVTVRYRVPAARRGAHQLGPILEERSDPLGLVVRTIEHSVVEEVVVHPVLHRLEVRTTGVRERRDALLLPRLSHDPLAEFRALRDYEPGDDPRLIHWASSARTGSLVVRDFLELRRATRAVILETLDSALPAAAFEEAVEIAASLTVDAIERAVVVTARTRDRDHPGTDRPVPDRSAALELFGRVNRTPARATVPAPALRPLRDLPDQLFVVTGASSPLLRVFAANHWIRRALVVVRVAARPRDLPSIPFRTVDVASASQFAGTGR